MPQYQRITDFSGGQNERDDLSAVEPNVGELVQNAFMDRQGRLDTRWGVDPFGGGGATPGGLGVFDPPGVDKRLIGIWPPYIYHSTANESWNQAASGASLVNGLHKVVTGHDADSKWFSFVHSVEGYEATGDSYPASGLTWFSPEEGSYSQMAEFRPNVLTFWQGRMWAADSTATNYEGDHLFWSKILDATTWSLPGQNIRVDPAQGGRITALIPARGNTPQMYVFKDNAIYLFEVVWGTDGYVPLTANDLDTTKAIVRPISKDVGCVAPASALWVPSSRGADIWFLAADGFRSLKRTQDDVASGAAGPPLSETIPTTVGRINYSYARRTWATAFENYVLFAVPLDGAKHPTHMVVKNVLAPDDKGWGLWDLQAAALATVDLPNRRLFMQCSTSYSAALAAGDTLAAHVYELSDSVDIQNPGEAWIEKKYDTREFDLEAPLRRKRALWCEVQYNTNSDTGATVTIDYRLDSTATWQNLGYFYAEPSPEYPTIPALLPLTFDTESPIHSKNLDMDQLNAAYRVQLRLYDTGPGKAVYRKVEIVGNVLPKEWSE
jgi:hypothetical protein